MIYEITSLFANKGDIFKRDIYPNISNPFDRVNILKIFLVNTYPNSDIIRYAISQVYSQEE